MPRDSEPKIIHREWPGEGYVEMVQFDRKTKMFAVSGPLYYEFETPDALAAYTKDSKLQNNPNIKKDNYPGRWRREPVAYKEKINGEITDKFEEVLIPIRKCPWGVPGPVPEEVGALYEDIRQFVIDHVDFTDPRLYDLVTAWIMATWVLEAWDVVPYIFLMGPKASGKTRVLEVLRALAYRAILTSTASEAALYTCIESWKTTMLLDEIERYGKEKYETAQNLLNSGYRRDSPAIRVKIEEGGFRVLETYDVFGLKALAGTEGLLPTLESRSIIIRMAKARRKVRFTIDQRRAQALRSRLLVWRWTMLDRIEELNRVHVEDAVTALDFADGRFVELYAALYAVSPEARTAIITYARDSAQEYADEEATSIEAEVAIVVLKLRGAINEGKFTVAQVVESYNAERSPDEALGSRVVGRVIKRLGFVKTRGAGGRAAYRWDVELLKALAKRYDIDEKISGFKAGELGIRLGDYPAKPAASDVIDVIDDHPEGVPPPSRPEAPNFDKFEADAVRVLEEGGGSVGEALFKRGMYARGHNPATTLDRLRDLDARGVVRYNAGVSVTLLKGENDEMIDERAGTPAVEKAPQPSTSTEAPTQ